MVFAFEPFQERETLDTWSDAWLDIKLTLSSQLILCSGNESFPASLPRVASGVIESNA